MPRILIAALITIALLAGACGGEATNEGAATPGARREETPGAGEEAARATASPSSHRLLIHGTRFPTALTVAVGAAVEVVNEDEVRHTVTADGGDFDVQVDPRERTTFVAPARAGSYPYHCNIHPAMRATLTVTSGNFEREKP